MVFQIYFQHIFELPLNIYQIQVAFLKDNFLEV